jgi:hypothetical protein
VARKQHVGKEGKATCKRKSNVAHEQASLTMMGLGFLIRIVTTISLKNSINKNLGGLGSGMLVEDVKEFYAVDCKRSCRRVE